MKVRYIKIIFICLFICFNAPCLYAEHDNSLRTDLNFHYTINDQFQSVSYVFLQADKNMSNYDYVEWGTGSAVSDASCLALVSCLLSAGIFKG